jgi:predicted DNA-binding transcriptional regulator AlpA
MEAMNTTTTTTDRPLRLLLTPRESAAALGLCEKTLWSLTDPRGPIRCVRIGRAVRYDPADLSAWVESAKSTSPQAGAKKTCENEK